MKISYEEFNDLQEQQIIRDAAQAVELLDKYCSECGQKLMEWI